MGLSITGQDPKCVRAFFLFGVNCNQRLFPLLVSKMLERTSIYITDISAGILYANCCNPFCLFLQFLFLTLHRPNYSSYADK